MLSHFVVISPLNESPEEVLSYVRPASQFCPIRIERRKLFARQPY
jgi:hypothetical protein